MGAIVPDKKFYLKDILEILPNCKISGNRDKYFVNVKSLNEADENSLIWIKSGYKNSQEVINNTKASFILCDDSMPIPDQILEKKCIVIVTNPRLSLARILSKLFVTRPQFGVDRTAIIDNNAKLANNIFVGPHSYIGKAEIGEGTSIYGNTYIYDDVKIGKNCIIHAGAVIGADGFGFEKDEEGKWFKIPQIGGVVISNNVEIGANTCIDRGTLGNTVISDGVKIDNLSQIAHNVSIGSNTIIAGGVKIGGSTKVGNNCWVAPNVAILNGINIGDNVFIGIGSVVIRNIKSRSKVYGNPAVEINNR